MATTKQYDYTVVGSFRADGAADTGDDMLNKANAALSAAGVPVFLQTAEPVAWGGPEFAIQMRDAETMLLDWLTDAEIGETMYNALHHIDQARAGLRKYLDHPGPIHPLDHTFAEVVEARKMVATFVKWCNDIGIRRGRTGLIASQAAALEEGGDTLND